MTPDPIHRTWINSDRFVPKRFVRPVQEFMNIEAAGGVVLLVAAVIALVWANAPFGETYKHFWETHVVIEIGGFHFAETFEALVNDGLMAIFFFVVGLEIKRELVLGDLRDPRAAALPVLAAIGGMIFPALIYVGIVAGNVPPATHGWGVPVATDIAFAVGVLSLIGKKVPSGAKLFLLALAIADDLGGILVIALFYTANLSMMWLGLGILGLIAIYVAGRVGIRSYLFYFPVALAVWFFFLESGVHATVAGVALAFLTPVRPMYSAAEFDRKARRVLDTFPVGAEGDVAAGEHATYEALTLADMAKEAVAPLSRLEHRLAPWSSFVIVPLFALANAGVRFEGSPLVELTSKVALGVALGLVVGKTVGITLFSWISVKLGLAKLPPHVNWRHVVGTAATAGIGFTVALFITALAFSEPLLTDEAKVGIFAGSLVAGILGAAIFALGKDVDEQQPSGEPVDVPIGA